MASHISTVITSHAFVLSKADFLEAVRRMRLGCTLVAVGAVIETLARLAAIPWAKNFLGSSVRMHRQGTS